MTFSQQQSIIMIQKKEMLNRFNTIPLPLQLVKQNTFSNKISDMNLKMLKNTEYLKSLIQRNHKIYQNCSKDILKLLQTTEKKILNDNHSSEQIAVFDTREQKHFIKFIQNIREIFDCLNKQTSKTQILMNNNKMDDIKKIMDVVNLKLSKTGESVTNFGNLVREYNACGAEYIKKCEYFQDFENNPIKYYSLTKNQQKYQKVKKIEAELEHRLQNITVLKGEIRDMMAQLTVKVRDFYHSIKLRIQDYLNNSSLAIKKLQDLLQGFQKIEQASQRAQEQSEMDKSTNMLVSRGKRNMQGSHSARRQIKQIKREKRIQYQRQIDFRNLIFQFLESFLTIIQTTINLLEKVMTGDDFKNFDNEKGVRNQILTPKTNYQINLIIEKLGTMQKIFIGIRGIVSSQKGIFQEIFNVHELYYKRFITDIEHFQDEQIDNLSTQEQMEILKKLRQSERKFNFDSLEWKKQLQINFKQIANRIRNTFLNKSNIKIDMKNMNAENVSDLFSHKHFQILKLDIFDHKKALPMFIRSDMIMNYQDIVKSNRLKRFLVEFQMQNEKQPMQKQKLKSTRKIEKSKSSCCGLFRKKVETNEQQNFVKQVKQTKQIDHFSCALKDGYMLYQGQIKLYPNYLRFKSQFNPFTFFGATDILIPKFEIFQLIKGRHIVSELITVVTRRGSVQFTSFFTDPFEILLENYITNRNTQYEAATHMNMNMNEGEMLLKPQLETLKMKMQKQFLELANAEKFKVTKTSATERENQIQVAYQYKDQLLYPSQPQFQNSSHLASLSAIPQPNPSFTLRVTIKWYENSLEYVFWHGENQTLPRKKKLETIIKNLIKQDRVKNVDNIHRQIKNKQNRGRDAVLGPNVDHKDDNFSFHMDEQFSIIGSREKHVLDFKDFNNNNYNKNQSVDLHKLMLNNQTNLGSGLYEFESNKKQKKIDYRNILPLNSNESLPSQQQKVTNTNTPIIPKSPISSIIKKSQFQIPSPFQVESPPRFEGQPFGSQPQPFGQKPQNSSFQSSQKRAKTQQQQNTNELKNKKQVSIQVSQNASTVKYAERKQTTKSNKNLHKNGNDCANANTNQNWSKKSLETDKYNKSREEEIRTQGIKTFIYLAAIAVGLIFITRVFQ